MMVIFIKIVIWFVLFFTWLFSKLVWNENSTPFRDVFSFIYFFYLLFYLLFRAVRTDYVNNFSFIEWVILIFFILSIIQDVIRGLRYIVGIITVKNIAIGDKVLDVYDKIKDFLFAKQIEDTAEILLPSILIGLTYVQLNIKKVMLGKVEIDYSPTMDLVNKSNIELLGFVVAILSMYGVYIGFLQYLASDAKSDMYLGRSKVNYLVKKSFWYHVTQSKTFILMLLSVMVVPMLVKLNIGFAKELTILWQTSYFLLLIIYIFLLRMSLYIIKVALLMKAKSDENLKKNMRREIQREYKDLFWTIYCGRKHYSTNFIENKLSHDLEKIDKNEHGEFIRNIFGEEYFDDRNLHYSIMNKLNIGFKLPQSKKINNWLTTRIPILNDEPCLKTYQDKNNYDLREEWGDFYSYLKNFTFEKWNFLYKKDILEIINFQCYKPLLESDQVIFEKILNKDNLITESILKLEMSSITPSYLNPSSENYKLSSDSILVYLLDLQYNLIKNTDSSRYVQKVIDETLETTRKIKDNSKNYSKIKMSFFNQLESHKWRQILDIMDKCESSSSISLPNQDVFLFEFSEHILEDLNNTNLYSQIFLEKIIEEYNENLYRAMNSLYKILYQLYQLTVNNNDTEANWKINELIKLLNGPVEFIAYQLVDILYDNEILLDKISIKEQYENKLGKKLLKYDVIHQRKRELEILNNERGLSYLSITESKSEIAIQINSYELLSYFVLLNELNGKFKSKNEWIDGVNKNIIRILEDEDINFDNLVRDTIKLFNEKSIVERNELEKIFIDDRKANSYIDYL
ncbi:hypothetical protein ACVRWL_06935 [Streptococcus ratti]|nr:hypothetical protein [Streptococcus ratti]